MPDSDHSHKPHLRRSCPDSLASLPITPADDVAIKPPPGCCELPGLAEESMDEALLEALIPARIRARGLGGLRAAARALEKGPEHSAGNQYLFRAAADSVTAAEPCATESLVLLGTVEKRQDRRRAMLLAATLSDGGKEPVLSRGFWVISVKPHSLVGSNR